ncbi:hypothetical protein [Tritonibacter mobilis]|uniref:hypothetical protein n=1 Tax=Tritonibacter mobilis TaxID=379347 RepID=UPI001C08C452|nr:hypothetical protein [Tritonibacter mobilis]MBU3032670.1 hypothetical protein [Tritonibacter mobilis]WHQ81868.1 hypothetical protein OMR53_11735 [Tritonibacter mobilis]
MTVKFVERTRKRALSILAHIKKLQDEESLMTPEFARSQAEIVRAIDISQEIESWMSELANLLPMGACTSMPMKSLRLELRDASKIRRPSSLEVSELRRKIDITMSEHIAMIHAREHIRDLGAELRELDVFESGADRRSSFIAHRNWRTVETGWRLQDWHWTYILKLEVDGFWSGIIRPPRQEGVFIGRFSKSLVEARGDLFDAAERMRQN